MPHALSVPKKYCWPGGQLVQSVHVPPSGPGPQPLRYWPLIPSVNPGVPPSQRSQGAHAPTETVWCGEPQPARNVGWEYVQGQADLFSNKFGALPAHL